MRFQRLVRGEKEGFNCICGLVANASFRVHLLVCLPDFYHHRSVCCNQEVLEWIANIGSR